MMETPIKGRDQLRFFLNSGKLDESKMSRITTSEWIRESVEMDARGRLQQRFWISVLLVVAFVNFATLTRQSYSQEIKVPDGFTITKVATDDLASNIYSLTIDSNGAVVVAGPGYIRRLIDENDDGVFDRAQQISDVPKNGAMGLCFEEDRLYAVGDQGVLRLSDPDGDGVMDDLEVMLEVKTGGEHDAHAIRKGPDGHWYLLCGNKVDPASIDPGKEKKRGLFASLLGHGVHAGFLLRISPDFSKQEFHSWGFRNPYDFDFNTDGDPFTFDSDGERDISLPWYQPCRVFRLRPGNDAGWMSANHKLADDHEGMPVVISRLGRGSPTGVVCYRHFQFPDEYFDSIFVLDWTFGRIVVHKRDPQTGEYSQGELFAEPDGVTGFAVTDAEVGVDGSLYVSVGGRGTEGSVYRIQSKQAGAKPNGLLAQPNSSWARRFRNDVVGNEDATWEKTLLMLNEGAESTTQKLQQIDNTEQSCGAIPPSVFGSLKSGTDRRIVSRLLSGILPDSVINREQEKSLLLLKRRLCALEFGPGVLDLILEIDEKDLEDFNFVDWGAPLESAIPLPIAMHGDSIASLAYADDSFGLLTAFVPDGNSEKWPLVFQGYFDTRFDSRLDSEKELELILAELELGLSMSKGRLFRNMSQTIAIFGVGSPELQNQILEKITPDSDPVEDIHYLLVLTRMSQEVSVAQKQKLANSLLAVPEKLKSRNLNIDRNWPIRMRELASTMVREFKLEKELIENDALLESENYYLMEIFEPKQQKVIRAQLADLIQQDESLASNEHLQFLAEDPNNRYCDLLRKFRDRPDFLDALMPSLAIAPIPDDRDFFLQGMSSANRESWRLAAFGLWHLPVPVDPVELSHDSLTILTAGVRLGNDRSEVRIRKVITKLLASWHRGTDNKTIDDWSSHLAKKYPKEFAERLGGLGDRLANQKRFAKLDFSGGDATQGRAVYKQLLCAKCHDGGRRLGPSLSGLGNRFSDTDILASILDPDQQVAERYRAHKILTGDGDLFLGSVIYESVDGVVFADRNTNTIRIESDNIGQRTLSNSSMMPSGLLDNATDEQVVDLMAYLKSLKK